MNNIEGKEEARKRGKVDFAKGEGGGINETGAR